MECGKETVSTLFRFFFAPTTEWKFRILVLVIVINEWRSRISKFMGYSLNSNDLNVDYCLFYVGNSVFNIFQTSVCRKNGSFQNDTCFCGQPNAFWFSKWGILLIIKYFCEKCYKVSEETLEMSEVIRPLFYIEYSILKEKEKYPILVFWINSSSLLLMWKR